MMLVFTIGQIASSRWCGTRNDWCLKGLSSKPFNIPSLRGGTTKQSPGYVQNKLIKWIGKSSAPDRNLQFNRSNVVKPDHNLLERDSQCVKNKLLKWIAAFGLWGTVILYYYLWVTWHNPDKSGQIIRLTIKGYVYILTNKNNSVLYTGVTSDLKDRMNQHKEKKHRNSFSARYNLCKLVYYETFESIVEAIRREKQIKAGTRRAKIRLISGLNPEWEDLRDSALP